MRYPKSLLSYCLAILSVLLGIVVAAWVMISGKESSGRFHGKFFERVAPVSSDVYRVKKVDRDGEGFYYVKKMEDKKQFESRQKASNQFPKRVLVRGRLRVEISGGRISKSLFIPNLPAIRVGEYPVRAETDRGGCLYPPFLFLPDNSCPSSGTGASRFPSGQTV